MSDLTSESAIDVPPGSLGLSESVNLGDDGSIQMSPLRLPFSAYASSAAETEQRAKFDRIERLREAAMLADMTNSAGANAWRRVVDHHMLDTLLADQRRHFAVTMVEERLGNVSVQTFVPTDGIKPENDGRVLINLHGGGFLVGWGAGSQLESIPMAAVAGVKVISVDYRMYPEARFPAASEDVAAVYRALLDSHLPSNIALYGCSAGGLLASAAMTWFDQMGLPRPAAIALWSAALDPRWVGDSAYLTAQMGSYMPAPTDMGIVDVAKFYFGDATLDDPLVAPSASTEALAKFPPTLFVTGSRAGEMSAAAQSHIQLLSAGVTSQLLLWDGLDHAFMYNPELPESQQTYSLTARFLLEAMDQAGILAPN